METRKDPLKKLESIAAKMDKIGEDLRNLERIWAEETEDRKAKGLTGDEAIEHYNQWMIDAGFPEYVVKD